MEPRARGAPCLDGKRPAAPQKSSDPSARSGFELLNGKPPSVLRPLIGSADSSLDVAFHLHPPTPGGSHMKWIAVFGLLTVLAASDSYAAQQGAGKANNVTTFLTHAAQDGEAEIELGKLAQEKAADAKVKDF